MRRVALRSSDALLQISRRTAARHTSTGLGALNSQRRLLHEPQTLQYEIPGGMGGFMSPETLNVVATDYQKGLLDRLNEETKDTELKGQSVWRQIQELAPRRDKVLAFNYASQALNNSFFLDMLKPPNPSTPPSESLQGHEHYLSERPKFAGQIDADFGSLTGLKSAFSAAAMGMMGSGWVWLVYDDRGRLAVTATYGAGTMLVRTREQRGPRDWVLGAPETSPTPIPPTPYSRYLTQGPYSLTGRSSPSSGTQMRQRTGLDSNNNNKTLKPSVREISDYSASVAFRNTARALTKSYDGPAPGGMLSPLLTCSIHEHCWLRDHGIWGKEAYLQNFWDVVDWRKVGTIWSQFHTLKKDFGE
ncbi:hypothetical protein FRB94_009213 [Tulasnella sp. JGI-2019a]|nr:hypothetical protein FRB93_008342 [Tulasnella sp. JGI-2019a]KAG8995351.1 hypothetical protein FRB94_009213 [Tulasnella sp. JGI-2019a]KAG9026591.1 hypothetical protein FRB95_008678 [Tulasnella sp. JGI-2019a]